MREKKFTKILKKFKMICKNGRKSECKGNKPIITKSQISKCQNDKMPNTNWRNFKLKNFIIRRISVWDLNI